MGAVSGQADSMEVVRSLDEFDRGSGSWLERLVFNHRAILVALCLIVTVAMGWAAADKLQFSASFERTFPQGHAYIRNYLANRGELRGLGNSVRIVVGRTDGATIFDAGYLETLRKINDDVFLLPGVDRAWMKSLWTPVVRWSEVTEQGFDGGEVIPTDYDASPASVAQVQMNVMRAGIVGSLVSNDFKSSLIVVPLLDRDPATGKEPDFGALAHAIEKDIRDKYQADGKVKIHVVGFAKLIGDLLDGLVQVAMYFLIAALIAAGIIFAYTRCWRSTLLVLLCSAVAVVWQLGIISMLGFKLDPYSVLVPFLVAAIGVSHGAQKMNGIMQDIGRGTQRLVAARYTFRRLFLAGLTALLADAVGFAVLMVIDIPVIHDLAVCASVGVAVLVFTNLLLLPVLLSYTGVSARAAQRSLAAETQGGNTGMRRLWDVLGHLTERRWATAVVIATVLAATGGYLVSRDLKIGDLDPGAPELRANSRYNRDNAYITSHYSLSSDQFAVIVKTPAEGCLKYATLDATDRLGWTLQQLPGVQATTSLGDAVRLFTAGSYEGNLKWLTIPNNQDAINMSAQMASASTPDLFNSDCSVIPLIVYLADHKADTLARVAAASQDFATKYSTKDMQFMLAAGNAGIETATNEVVYAGQHRMLLYVYAAVILLCLVTFRSWRATVVAVVPLVITSILCEALMVALGIGVKVATLPVIALGVGIGVDYALYLVSVMLARLRAGDDLQQAYRSALGFTGKVVALVGATLAAGVVTWVWSPIKFQADMGILLTFMFLWNMIGALVLIPALSHFLLRPRR
ncbi:efflux RND transporter permease subunit [Lysobacter fragariae]